jgi:hypothetical protein
LETPANNIAVVRFGISRHLGALFGPGKKEVKGKRTPLSQERPPCGTHCDFILYPTLLDWFNDQQIHVAVLIRGSVGIGSEENHLHGVKLFHENFQIRQESVGYPVDWITRVSQDEAGRGQSFICSFFRFYFQGKAVAPAARFLMLNVEC